MKRRFGTSLWIVLLCIALSMLVSSVALAQEPATLPVTGSANRSNEYITQLDQLRTMGARSATRTLAHPEVYEFSSDLQKLNALAAPVPAYLANDAYAYITVLDQLRTMAYDQ